MGIDYNNDFWVEAIKNLEIEKRLLGIIIYGCPYLFNKIKKSIHFSIPLAYTTCQTEEAQKQILNRILKAKKSNKKFIKEFTE